VWCNRENMFRKFNNSILIVREMKCGKLHGNIPVPVNCMERSNHMLYVLHLRHLKVFRNDGRH